jgi:L-ascorbate metabolism protein UlaG (beta-lactamase superfamily)
MLTGKLLIDDVNQATPQAGHLAFWWLGQQSWIVKIGRTVLYLDPFLTPLDGRTTPALAKPEELTNATIISGTHDHGDHIDRPVWPVLAKASPAAKFIVPGLLLEGLARDLGIPEDRFVGIDDGSSAEVAGMRITGVAAAHEMLDRDEATGRYPHMTYVFEAGGLSVFHAGDTCNYEGLETKLKRWPRFDLALVPINGRDAVRLRSGCIGNMTYQEAADLAGALAPRLTVAAHWDMFRMNSEDPQKFVDYMAVKYPGLGTAVPRHGERVVL